MPAPDELTALGYRYTFTTSVEGEDGRAVVKLEGSPKPRLVTWATSTDDQRAAVQVDIDPPLAYDVPDFGDWVEIPAGVTREGDGERTEEGTRASPSTPSPPTSRPGSPRTA